MAVPNSLARPGVCTSLTRPVNPFEGQVIYETDSNDTLVWTGSAWLNLHFASFDAKGNLFVGTGVSTGTNVSVGTNNSVLTADSTTASGVAWKNTLSVSSITASGSVTAGTFNGVLTGQISVTVENVTGSTLAKGTPVYINGFGVTGNPTVDVSDSDSLSTIPVLGLLNENIANTATGQCVLFGIINNIDTSAYTVNSQLYVTNAGTLTDDRPSASSDTIQPMGRTLKTHASTGQILVTAGLPTISSPNSINVPGTISTSSGLTSPQGTFTVGVSAAQVTASASVTAPAVTASTSLTVQGVQIDASGANIDEVLVFNGTKFAPANIDTGGKSFAYFMGA